MITIRLRRAKYDVVAVEDGYQALSAVLEREGGRVGATAFGALGAPP